MAYLDLRDFMAQLERTGELRRVAAEVSPHLEMTALCDRALDLSFDQRGINGKADILCRSKRK